MKKRQTKRKAMSAVALSAMLFNAALPSGAVLASTDSSVEQNKPSNGFSADEVNRILAGLTDEQKANINKLTGADNTQKNHVDQKDLKSGKNIDVIVQFKVDPAKIQMIKKSLANGGASAQSFAADYSSAKQKVADAHKVFKTFVSAQPNQSIIGGKPVASRIAITREFTDSFNGVSLNIPANLVDTITNRPEVASVWSVIDMSIPDGTPSGVNVSTNEATPTTGGKPTSGLKWLGVDKLQAEGHTGIFESGARKGQRVKVGVLDTGIDYNHPDLYKVTHDENGHLYEGHDFINETVDTDGTVTQVDDHNPMETIYPDWVDARENPNPLEGQPSANYKDYVTLHGTHVSGTIAASTTNNNSIYSANGVAPDVELHGYRVLGPGGHGSSYSVLSGIEQSVKDKMDVINLSLGATINNPFYPTSIAINNATLQGVICSVSAGNAGPGASTVGSPGTSPLAITVGASTIPEEIPVQTLKFGNQSYQSRLFGKNFADADDAFKGQSIPIIDVGMGSSGDYSGIDVKGKIVLVKRGVDYLTTKMQNAANAGAKGMIIWDNQSDEETEGYIPNFLGINNENIYSVSITNAQGQALVDAIKQDKEHAAITYPMTLDAPILKPADQLADFSSTGPVKDWSIKPDIISPGVDIMSTIPYDIWEPNAEKDYKYSYESESGTSMAAPHLTGVAALVLAAHPDYTPADVKTAIMNTAKDVNTDKKTYSVYQVGAGRVDPVRAINSEIKIQVLDKATSIENVDGNDQYTQIDNVTGSFSFGFKGRGEGATNGSDDVVSSKDFEITNQGTNNKTFKLSSSFISTKFAQSNSVGKGTGNDVKINFSQNGSDVSSISVAGGQKAKAKASIVVPANALDGTYEGYVNVVNANDATESYRLPFTITIAEKGIDFKVNIKAMTLTERDTGNYSPNTDGQPASAYTFSVNSAMESIYILLKDKDGNYIGLAQNASNIAGAGPGVQYGPNLVLYGGYYLPFTKPYNGSIDASGLATKPELLKDGVYSLEIVATDKDGKQYKKEESVYVDYNAPTIKMDDDSKPGIYEIDPTGYLPGQEIKAFYGTVYDSNIDRMKQNGESAVPSLDDISKDAPVDQALNMVWGYQDGPFLTTILRTNKEGRVHFGLSPEDVTSKGSNFWFYPSDYSGAGDINTTQQNYYFIKKGSPYVKVSSTDGVDTVNDKVVVEPNKPFKGNITSKNAKGMTGGTFTLNSQAYEFSNIRLSDEYKQYLQNKGITPTLTVSQPYDDQHEGGKSTDITISGIPASGALVNDMKLLDYDVTLKVNDVVVGPFSYFVTKASFTYDGDNKTIPAFNANWPYVKQPVSNISGGLFAESFKANSLSGSFANITTDTGAKVTATDDKGNTFTTNNPTSSTNTVQYGNATGTYMLTTNVSDKPYKVVTSMPGHFKGYQTTPVIGNERYGYQSGSSYDFPSMDTPLLLAGDVNGDDVIDMNDLVSEIQAYADYDFLKGVLAPSAEKAAFFTDSAQHRNNDIAYAFSGQNQVGGYSFSNIDYNDFYYIFKNFGKQNQSAIAAGKTVPTPQLTVPQNLSIASNRGTYTGASYDSKVKTYNLTAGNSLADVMNTLNFAGPTQKTSVTTIPTLNELKAGSSITLVPTSTTMLDDEVWRKAISKVEVGLGGVFTDVTNAIVPNTSNQAVTVSAGYTYFDSQKGQTYVPARIGLNGSLFDKTGTYTVRITAKGYAPVNASFTVTEVPIPTPTIGMIADPAKAHIGNDVTFNFTDDAKWREGINKVVLTTTSGKSTVDLSTIANGSSYYDISKPGQITFKKDLFKTNSTLDPATTSTYQNATINPGGANYLPTNYKIDIYSTGQDGTIYPVVSIGADSTFTAMQSVGYGITFDSKGGSGVGQIAVGYKPSNSRYGSSSLLIANSNQLTNNSSNPKPTRQGYVFAGWYNVDPNTNELTTLWDANKNIASDIKLAAKWQVNYTQNFAQVDKTKPDGAVFNANVYGEGPLEISIPDYNTTTPWLTDKSKIDKIEATYRKIKSDGTTDTVDTTITLDPSTYNFVDIGNGSGKLTFTTATEKYASEHPGENFAFGGANGTASSNGYQIKVTGKLGDSISIPNVKLAYRRHVDLNGGVLKDPKETFFDDKLVYGKVSGINMDSAALKVTKGNLAMMPSLYYDAAGSTGQNVPISLTDSMMIHDNATYYIGWVKAAPAVGTDTIGNVVGSDITLPFTDDGTWRNNIKSVKIGSKELSQTTDYTITYDQTSKKGSINLNKALFTAGQKINITIASEGYLDATVVDQIIGHLVSFETNGGDAIAPKVVDSRLTKPEEPTKVGYKFIGWYSDSALTTPFDFTTIITKSTTLYAKYALATSIVTTDTSDNAVGNNITLEFTDKDWARAITSIQLGGSVIDQSKYNVDLANGTITLDKSLFSKAGEFNIIISANEYADVSVSQKIVNGYNIHFVVKGEKAPFEVKDQIVSRRITEPVVHGYELTWFADEDCTIPWDFTSSIYSSKTIYGKWKPAKYIVVYNTQDAGLVVSLKAEYNTLLEETIPTRTGYTFLGWYKEAEGKTLWNFATDKVTDNTILYAKWSINSYTVHFNSNGGNQVADKTANYNTGIASPSTTRTGYTLVGWSKDAAGKVAWNFATDKVTNDTTLYAKWQINSYKVSYVSNGGSTVPTQTANYNSVVNLPKPTKTGYAFAGWYKDASLKTPVGNSVTLTNNITLYAKWNINTYTVKFNSNGGSSVASKTATYNGAISQPKSPTRKGYTFLGWYKDAAGKVTWNFTKDHITANTTIYAKWVANPAKPSNAKLSKAGKDSVKLSWSKVSGATGYEIVKATSKTGSYSHLTSVTTTNYTNKGLSKGKTYYYKIRSYKLVGSQKIYGEWTSVLSIKL
ncbi:hypothetical protein CN692_08265 [Bacillus sp. AFS002410]|uniref:InlB B-repeat-containing protein n=1 Tax=Bacillus sp. AFS002410 TaxID=2033481 RepID=UPI000BEFA235|nr:InlB B-repeat-containing protein [Bacillus sp. AFS002410]PEJ58265.1 hypothetical protein CN692_08265 [Bacillus sp. AFS002410]